MRAVAAQSRRIRLQLLALALVACGPARSDEHATRDATPPPPVDSVLFIHRALNIHSPIFSDTIWLDVCGASAPVLTAMDIERAQVPEWVPLPCGQQPVTHALRLSVRSLTCDSLSCRVTGDAKRAIASWTWTVTMERPTATIKFPNVTEVQLSEWREEATQSVNPALTGPADSVRFIQRALDVHAAVFAGTIWVDACKASPTVLSAIENGSALTGRWKPRTCRQRGEPTDLYLIVRSVTCDALTCVVKGFARGPMFGWTWTVTMERAAGTTTPKVLGVRLWDWLRV